MIESLRARIIRHEGLRLKPYRDTKGKLTIGVGRNLDDVGISESEAYMLLDNDLARARSDLMKNLLWAGNLDSARFGVLLEMIFQLGIGKVMGFTNTLAALQKGDYKAAAAGMRGSLWAKQTPARVEELAKIMESGIG